MALPQYIYLNFCKSLVDGSTSTVFMQQTGSLMYSTLVVATSDKPRTSIRVVRNNLCVCIKLVNPSVQMMNVYIFDDPVV